MPLAALGWAVMVITWPWCGAGRADAEAGAALAAAMSRLPPAAAAAIAVAASACLKRDPDGLPLVVRVAAHTNDAPWCAFGSVTLAFEWPTAVRGRPAAGSFRSRFSAVSGLLFSVPAIPLWGEKQ